MSSASYKHWVLNRGGVRKIHICAITNLRTGEVQGIGHAICSPEDEYNAERGREIAQGRALKQYQSRPRTQLDEIHDEQELLNKIEEIYAPDVDWDAHNRFG